MDLITNLSLGFSVAFTPINLMYAFVGCLLGTLIGVLPGIGPLATIAMLLPATYALPPVSALIMLAGIYYGAQYGGSTTAILVNLPGESSSVVTVRVDPCWPAVPLSIRPVTVVFWVPLPLPGASANIETGRQVWRR